jgi:hypothetical protein
MHSDPSVMRMLHNYKLADCIQLLNILLPLGNSWPACCKNSGLLLR